MDSSASSALDPAAVRRIARLARIRLADEDVAQLQTELAAILGWIEQLNEVDVSGVDPLASVGAALLAMRADVVTEGDQTEAILANAPARSGPFFTVPKVVE
jgi:aspartyl-tRNA(Asn)/glutamyl-tRNA(Gln) amidotransferase subunit C